MNAFSSKLSRRTFIKQNSMAGLGVALASSSVAGLPVIGSKSAQMPAILGGPSAWAEVKYKHYVLAGLQLANPVRPTVTGYPGDPRIVDIRLTADF